MSSERRTPLRGVPSPLKWHIDGGKHYLASKIVDLMPPHTHYVEPYAGGLAVLLAKDPEGVSEVVNDINGDLVNFWRHLQDPVSLELMRRRLEATPFAQSEFVRACEMLKPHGDRPGTPLENACAFFVHCRQSLAGRMKAFAPTSKNRTRRGMNEQVSAWLTAVEGLPAVHERLKRVFVFNRPALDVIREQDGPGTCFYLDPPYLHEMRNTTTEYGEHEMSEADHHELVGGLWKLKAKVMLSGYQSRLYDDHLSSWNRHDFSLPNNAGGGKTKRRMVESVWCNF